MNEKINYTVPHCEDGRPIIAEGHIEEQYFIGEYKFNGMTYGCTIKVPFKKFTDEKPKDKAPLIVKFENGTIDHAYYVVCTNTLYPRNCHNRLKAIYWSYR